MKIPPQLRPTDAAPHPGPLRPPPVRLSGLRGAILLLRVLALCANTAAYAQPAPSISATPEQKFSPGYLEAVSTGYENGQALNIGDGMAALRPARIERGAPAPSTPSAAPGAAGAMAPPPAVPRRVAPR
ncbi:hypothetical protein [Cupriavidus campinensis]